MVNLIALYKRGWHEIPHIMFGSIIFVSSAVMLAIGIRRHNKYERHRALWKRRYTVVREEDFDPKKQVLLPHDYAPIF